MTPPRSDGGAGQDLDGCAPDSTPTDDPRHSHLLDALGDIERLLDERDAVGRDLGPIGRVLVGLGDGRVLMADLTVRSAGGMEEAQLQFAEAAELAADVAGLARARHRYEMTRNERERRQMAEVDAESDVKFRQLVKADA